MDEIYVDYHAVKGLAERLRDYGENIQSTCKKMNDYLSSLNLLGGDQNENDSIFPSLSLK